MNKKEKVAVCFFGHLRTFKQCLPFIRKNLLSLYDCDIFMHTWDKYNHASKTWHNDRVNSSKLVAKNEIKRLLNITDEQIIVEEQPADNGEKVYNYENIVFSLFGLECVWYSMRSVNELRQKYAKLHDVNYDAVVFIRPDIFVNTPVNVTEAMSEDNAWYYVGNVAGIIGDIKQVKASDVFFWAKPDIIDGIMRNMIPQIKNGQTVLLPPEGLFVGSIVAKGYKPVLCANYRYGRDFWILRDKKFKFPNDIISLHIRKTGITIKILRLLGAVFNITISFFNLFVIDLGFGRPKEKRS